MFHRWKHILRSINVKREYYRFFAGLHSDAHIGAPNVEEARKEFLQAIQQQAYLGLR